MSRTIISVDPMLAQDGQEQLAIRLFRAPREYDGAKVGRILNIRIPDWGVLTIMAHGTELYQQLQIHPAVIEVIHDAFRSPIGQFQPLYFYLNAQNADQFRWEAIHDPKNGFLACDTRTSIGRMADSTVELLDTEIPLFAFPLRIAIVLSALGRPADEQWNEISQQILRNSQGAEICVFVSEAELFNNISLIAAQNPQITVKPITDKQGLLEDLNQFSPQILHLFCHGTMQAGGGQLHLAIGTDWQQNPPIKSSITIKLQDFLTRAGIKNVWLLVLNACEGAQGTNTMQSLARQAVSYGMPAVLGMMEEIDVNISNIFCKLFYSGLIRLLNQILTDENRGKRVEIEWCQILPEVREGLINEVGAGRQWTHPVIYVGVDPFKVMISPHEYHFDTLKEQRLRAIAVAEILQGLSPATPDAARDEILEILKDFPVEMKPDRAGNFPVAPQTVTGA